MAKQRRHCKPIRDATDEACLGGGLQQIGGFSGRECICAKGECCHQDQQPGRERAMMAQNASCISIGVCRRDDQAGELVPVWPPNQHLPSASWWIDRSASWTSPLMQYQGGRDGADRQLGVCVPVLRVSNLSAGDITLYAQCCGLRCSPSDLGIPAECLGHCSIDRSFSNSPGLRRAMRRAARISLGVQLRHGRHCR